VIVQADEFLDLSTVLISVASRPQSSGIRTGSTRVTAESPRRAALENVPKPIAAVATSAEYKESC
jgi:hypothetical protein